MKKTIAAVMIASAFASSTASATGIPVVTIASDIDRMMNQVENIAKYIEQIDQLKAQLKQAQQMFNSMNGVRGMAQLLNNPAARQYLPKDASTLYGLATNSGQFAGLSGSLNAIKQAAQIAKPSDMQNSEAGGILEQHQNLLASMQATAEASFNAAGQRFDQLQKLIDTVDLANDPKAAQDLQNRIQAEQVMMQNETTKLSMMMQLQAIQEKQIEQQSRERTAKMGLGQAVIANGF